MDIQDSINKNAEYELAKKWLIDNGEFIVTEKDLQEDVSLADNSVEVLFIATFRSNDNEQLVSIEGNDIVELTIGMYKAES